MGKWNLELGDIEPALSLYGRHGLMVTVDLPRFDTRPTGGEEDVRRGIPTMQIGDRFVTTVFDLTLAQCGVHRVGLPGDWPSGYDDPQPYYPRLAEIEHLGKHNGRIRGGVADGRSYVSMASFIGGLTGSGAWRSVSRIPRL